MIPIRRELTTTHLHDLTLELSSALLPCSIVGSAPVKLGGVELLVVVGASAVQTLVRSELIPLGCSAPPSTERLVIQAQPADTIILDPSSSSTCTASPSLQLLLPPVSSEPGDLLIRLERVAFRVSRVQAHLVGLELLQILCLDK